MSRIEFVRKKVSGKKGMLIGLMIATALILSGLSIFTMSSRGNGYSPPLVIRGYVTDQLGNPIAGATVNLTDVANGNWMVNTTNSSGYYSITFGGPGGPSWNEGDKLVGFAYYNGNQGSNDTIMWDIGKLWLNFTIDTPITTKHIIGPHHGHPVYGDYYYIRLNTIFNFTATDNDGINATYVRIWYNGQWHPTPGNGKGKNHNFWVYGTDIPKNFTLGDFPWAGEGKYYIEFYSDDKNKTIQGVEYTHNQSHDVDMTAPVYDIDFGCDTVNTTYNGLNYTMIKGCAPIWIHAYDTGICQSGVKWLNITGSYIGEWPGETVEPRFDIHIRDGGAGDLDGEENGEILANVSFCEDSFHELDIVITDYLGNEATYDRDIAVDYTVPTMVKTIVGPTYPGPHGNETWLNCNSTIWLNATDGGCNGGAGVKEIGFTIWWKKNESSPTWNTTKYPEIIVLDNGAYNSTIYDNDPNKGTISVKFHFKEDCYHLLKAWAIDYVGNNNTIAVKNKHYVDCTPPWINKTIPKIPFLIQDKIGSYAEIGTYNIYQGWIWDDNQSFTANWSYVDAVDVYLNGIDNEGNTWIEIWKGNQKVGESEEIFLEGNVNGWIQFHLKNRTYLEHGATYWLTVKTYYHGLTWAYNKTDPYHGGFAIVDGVPKTTYDFAFKLEYYPVFFNKTTPYPSHPEYSFKNGSYEHNGLNNTWITSKAFFNIASHDEGCMGGVGLESLQYRIWNESNGWSDWKNYTEPFNISDECKHYIQIKAVDHLGNIIISNQTHYVDNSPPTDVVDIPDVHGYYYDNITGKQFVRAGKGIWINLTDLPECAVGLRNATFYWNYTYTNFTMPNPEVHPSGPNDYFDGFDIVERDGKYWYVAYLDSEHSSVYISFDRECMHIIHYFYTATDWLDNEITSNIKNVTLYVDSGTPTVWDNYPWHYYQGNETEGHIRAGANFMLSAKDLPDIIKIVCIAQTEGNQTDTLQNYSIATPWQWDAQSFVAECDHINATKLYLQWFGDVNVTVYIHNDSTMNPSTALGMVTKHLTGSGEGWITFEFNPGIPLHVGETYYIEAHADPASMCSWNFTSSDEYAGGHAWISGENRSEFDWAFQIISYDPNPCASGIEGIYYGFYYKGVWHPINMTDNTSLYGEVINISKYYNDTEIDVQFGGHYLWYAIEDNSTRDNDPRHGFVSGNVAFYEECKHDFYYWAKDNVCHHTPVYSHTFYVDDSPPKVNIEMPKCYSPVYSVADKLDLVFVVDTSGSMNDEWNTLDNVMQSIIDNITAQGVNLSVTIYGLAYNKSTLPYGRGMYTVWFNGANQTASDEDWGPGTAWVALWYPWRKGAARVVIPISDENAYHGEPETAEDLQSIQEAVSACQNNSVVVYPFYGNDPWPNVISEMWELANGTGGKVFYFGNASNVTQDLLSAIVSAATVVKESISCNATMHLSAIDYPITNGKIVDQEQTTWNGYDAVENITWYTAQSFIPTADKLDAVELLIDTGSGGKINVSIYDSGLNLLGYTNLWIIGPLHEQWMQFYFSPSISLIPGETYWIVVTSEPNGSISWLWNHTADNYPNGMAIVTGSITLYDYAFKTEYYGDIEAECSAGLEGIYYGYEYNGIWHPASMDDNTTEHGMVFNISNYYSQEEIENEFGNHTLWYIYNDSLGITFFKECKHELYYWAKDNVCHHSIVYHKTLYVDNSPPNITKTHPSCYENINGTEYIQRGANITLYAADMPANNCSSGTWIYWRYVWHNYTSNESEYYPFFYHEGFEEKPIGWSIPYPWWGTTHTAHDGNVSIGTVNTSSYLGWSWLVSNNIQLPDVPKITLTFWQRADNLSYYDAANIFGIYNESNVFIPLKFFYKEDMSNEWQKVTIDLTPYANQTIKLAWVYENDYGDGEVWYIDDVNITGWYGAYGYNNVSVNISFNEECHHDLYYFAEDTTCHATEIHHQEYYVDGTAPETSYESILTNCTHGAVWNGNYWQACDWANISFVVNNTGIKPCIDPNVFTYVRYENKIWNESSNNFDIMKYPDAAHGEFINGEYWYNITGIMYLNITDACNHTVYYFSRDGVCNVEDVKSFEIHIDNAPPKTVPRFINFNCGEVPKVNNIYFINPHTLIGLNATDYPIGCASGVKETYYRVWKYNDSTGQFDIPLTDGWLVYTNPINLSELVDNYNSIHGTDLSVCGAYEIWYYSSDNCCHTEERNIMDVIVDCKPPTTTKEFAGKFVKGDIEGVSVTWVNGNTIIWLNATDGTGQRSGVKYIYWEIVNNVTDETGYSENPYENAKDYHLALSVADLINMFGLSDGRYDFFHWAIDRVCNEETTHHKQWIVIDTSAPTSRVAQESLPPEPYNITTLPFNITVVNITDHGYNGGVGICKVEVYYNYSTDNNTWSGWKLYAVNTSLIIKPDGSIANWTLSFDAPEGAGYYRFISIAYDRLGNKETPPYYFGTYDAGCYVYTDTEPPIVNKTYGAPNMQINLVNETGHAITSHTRIYINATDMPADDYTGIDKIYWSFDGITWYSTSSYNGLHTASYSFTPAEAGLTEGIIYTIFFKASDMIGHVSQLGKQKFIIDDTAPTVTVTIDGNDTMPFNITVNATDDTAGVKKITLYYRYSEDGDFSNVQWQMYDTEYCSNYTWHFKYAPAPTYYKPGYYQFYVYAEDNLGNNNSVPTVSTSPMASCYVPPIPEDFNGDGRVNVMDLYKIIANWGKDSSSPDWDTVQKYDLDGSGVIDAGDIYKLVLKWTG